MLAIRLPKADWAKAWRTMIEVAPVRLVADNPVYEVLPAHLGLLTARGFTYEVVSLRPRQPDPLAVFRVSFANAPAEQGLVSPLAKPAMNSEAMTLQCHSPEA